MLEETTNSLTAPREWGCCCGQLHLCAWEFQGQWTHSHLSWLLALFPLQSCLLGLPVTWALLSACPGCWIYCLESTFSTVICLRRGIDKSLKLHAVWLRLDVPLSFTHAQDCGSGLLTGHCACRLSLTDSHCCLAWALLCTEPVFPATC